MNKEFIYSTKDVCHIIGIPQRQAVHWAEKGIVIPDEGEADGYPSKRGYSYRNLFEFRLVKELVKHGIELRKTKLILSYIRQSGFYIQFKVGSSLSKDFIKGGEVDWLYVLDGSKFKIITRRIQNIKRPEKTETFIYGAGKTNEMQIEDKRFSHGRDEEDFSDAVSILKINLNAIRTEIDKNL